MLQTILDQKLKYEGEKLKKLDTYKVKASQYNHFEDHYKKKELNERWNKFPVGNIQRDLYSAYLIMNVKENLNEIDRELCINHWEVFKSSHDEEIDRLRTCDQTIASMGI